MNEKPPSLEHAIRASERRLARAICRFEDGPGYQSFRSDEFPGFYAGNGILSDGTKPEFGVSEWIEIFRRHFPKTLYPHITIVFPEGTRTPALLDSARERGLLVFPELLMAASINVLVNANSEKEIASVPQALDLAHDRQALFDLHLAEARSADWFESTESFKGLFNKTMTLSERVGIKWIGVKRDDGSGALASALGFFDEGPICRLQEVITEPSARRRGLATCLIREVARAAALRGVSALGLMAEEGEEGHRLYRTLGFEVLARDVTVMQY